MNRKVKKIFDHTFIDRLTHFGYLVRGIVYCLVGVLGWQLALGWRQNGAGVSQVLLTIAEQPGGQLLILVVSLGLASYSLWGIWRGVFNVLGLKNNLAGITQRLGYLMSAISYGSLAFAAGTLFFGGTLAATELGDSTGLTEQVFTIPFGQHLLFLMGIAWIVGGIAQGVLAYKGSFKKNLEENIPAARKWMTVFFGRTGVAARAIIFFFIGVFIVRAAIDLNPHEVYSWAEVLEFIGKIRFGSLLLAILSTGIIGFGCYSLLLSKHGEFGSE